jgi:hypothetical protein
MAVVPLITVDLRRSNRDEQPRASCRRQLSLNVAAARLQSVGDQIGVVMTALDA